MEQEKLKDVRPTYDIARWEKDFKNKLKMRESISRLDSRLNIYMSMDATMNSNMNNSIRSRSSCQ